MERAGYCLGTALAIVDLTVDTSVLIKVPDEEDSFHQSGIKAAGFANITAIVHSTDTIDTEP